MTEYKTCHSLLVAVACCGLACAQCSREPTPSRSRPLGIEINAKNTLGALSPVYRAGPWFAYRFAETPYIVDRFFRETVPGKVQYSYNPQLQASRDFEDYKRRMSEAYAPGTPLRQLVQHVIASGDTFFWGPFPCGMPKWLSTRPGDTRKLGPYMLSVESCSPPRCFGYECVMADQTRIKGWASIVDHTLRFLRELGIVNLGYFHGHEQEREWVGTEDEFYALYAEAAAAAKSVDSSILVGGIGAGHLLIPRARCTEYQIDSSVEEMCNTMAGWANPNGRPMVENFIAYVAAKDLPLDFINYHAFALPPSEFVDQGRTVRGWLKESAALHVRDFSKVEIYPGDWTRWAGTYPADYLDTEETAAYLIAALVEMNRGGIAWHSHDFDVFNGALEESVRKQRGERAQFIGDWPIFTRTQVIKPAYNAFKILAILSGKSSGGASERLGISMTDDDYVFGVASQTGDGGVTRVLLSSFAPGRGAMQLSYVLRSIRKCMLPKGYSEEDTRVISSALVAQGKAGPLGELSIESFNQLVSQTDFPAPLDDEQTRENLRTCGPSVEETLGELRGIRRAVDLSVSHLPAGDYQLRKYLIDRQHSNSCRLNKQTEDTPSDTECGIGGEIDRRAAIAELDALTTRRTTVGGFLRARGYTENDAQAGSRALETCQGDWSCIEMSLDNGYQALDRCQSHGTYDPGKCPNSEALKVEIKEAVRLGKQAHDGVLFFESPDAIEKINNMKGVALETAEEASLTLVSGEIFEKKFQLEPNSVVLIELSRQ